MYTSCTLYQTPEPTKYVIIWSTCKWKKVNTLKWTPDDSLQLNKFYFFYAALTDSSMHCIFICPFLCLFGRSIFEENWGGDQLLWRLSGTSVRPFSSHGQHSLSESMGIIDDVPHLIDHITAPSSRLVSTYFIQKVVCIDTLYPQSSTDVVRCCLP